MAVLKVSVLVEEDLIKRMAGRISLAQRFFVDMVPKEHPTQNSAFNVSLNGYARQHKPLKGYVPVLLWILWRRDYALLAFADVCCQLSLMSLDI